MTQPYLYQRKGVRQLRRFGGRGLIAWEPGCGKTLASLLYAQRYVAGKPIIAVCPASMKWVWEDEAKRHFNLRAEVLSGTRPLFGNRLLTAPLIVINYDILHAWLDTLQALEPKLVIIDESTYIGSYTARRTKAVRKLCQGVPHVLALSGTPLTNRPKELWPTLNILRPELFPSFFKFGFTFCAAKRDYWGWDFSGSSNLKRLHRILRNNLMIRLRKRDVLPELPARRVVIVPVELSDRREYNAAVADFLVWLASRDPGKARRARHAETICKLGELKRLAAQFKLPAVLSWINDFLAGSDGKLLAFGLHRSVVNAIHAAGAGASVKLDGATPAKERRLVVKKFQLDPTCRLFAGNLKAAGFGLTLTAASNAVFAELAWSPAVMDQGLDRCHRIGTQNPVTGWWFVAKDTIEEDLVALLAKKQRIAARVIDGSANGSGFDIFTELERRLKRKGK